MFLFKQCQCTCGLSLCLFCGDLHAYGFKLQGLGFIGGSCFLTLIKALVLDDWLALRLHGLEFEGFVGLGCWGLALWDRVLGLV